MWSGRSRSTAGPAWAYGTLPGHPEHGEEAFVVDRTGDGTVWLTVTAFSRAAKWYTRAGGPATRGLQHAYARRCGTVLHAAVRGFRTVGPQSAFRFRAAQRIRTPASSPTSSEGIVTRPSSAPDASSRCVGRIRTV